MNLFLIAQVFIIPVNQPSVQLEDGRAIIHWSRVDTSVTKYEVYRKAEGSEDVVKIGETTDTLLIDTTLKPGIAYLYMVRSFGPDDSTFVDSKWSQPVAIEQEKQGKEREYVLGVIAKERFPVLIFLLFFGFLFFYYYNQARMGKEIFIRRLAGLDAIDEAVGRSTEMGKPVVFVHGLTGLDDPNTISAVAILKYIAKKVAMYEIDLIVPNTDPLVLLASREAVKEGMLEAGRPDVYKEENIMFLTTQQFGYAAGVNGILVREKPGATFFMGYFYAESLVMAETAYTVGSISIAGTTAITQLPFFIAACDYTLIGEEMYAASAYLSRNPVEIGTIKSEDIAKLLIIAAILIGSILATLAQFGIGENLFNLYKALWTVTGG